MSSKTVTIVLSDRRPIRIVDADWDVVASARWHSGEHECQANEVAGINVRQHADGRMIVSAWRSRGPGGMPIGYRGAQAGVLVEPARTAAGEPTGSGEARKIADLVRAIRRCAGVLGMPELGDETIADLPAEDLV